MNKSPKVAIIADSMTQLGGADRLLLEIAKTFDHPDIYTSFYNKTAYPSEFHKLKIISFVDDKSFLQKIFIKFSRHISFLYPFFFEKLDLSDYDLIISISAGPSKGIVTTTSSKHINIICTPPHYQFGKHRNLRGHFGKNFINKFVTPFTDLFLRIWDYNAAQRADYTISISKYIQNIVKDVYHLESDLLYPPVNIDRFKASRTSGRFFLTVSRLYEYKRIDRAIKACNDLGLNLKIIGSGPDLNYLKSISGPTIEFLGEVDDEETANYYSKCKAFIFPGTEDFGITPIEAMAAGKAVVAYGQGGTTETVILSKTGVFFQDEDDNLGLPTLKEVLANFDSKKYNIQDLRKQAERFSNKVFEKNFKTLIKRVTKK